MISSVTAWRKAAHAINEQHQYRLGFMCALDRRIFPSLAPMMQPDNTSQAFVDGQRAALDCPLAVTVPEQIYHEFQDDDQYKLPVIIGIALFLLGIAVLWVTKG